MTAPRLSTRAPAARPVLHGIGISHATRVIDPATRVTKLDLAGYYEAVAEWMLPHLRGRPVSLTRAPDGIGGAVFVQKHATRREIPGISVLDPAIWPGHEALLEVDSVEALIGAAQMNTIEFHTWNASSRTLGKANRMIFDLDPGEGVAWKQVREGALLTRELLDQLGLESWLKTSGGRGLHVVVPLEVRWASETVRDVAQAVVVHLAKTIPERFVAKSGASNRVGKIFVDYLRNGIGATTVAAFSARARAGLGVSMPIAWEQLAKLKSSAQWSIANAPRHLAAQRTDPWAGYWKAHQSLARAIDALGLARH